MKKMKMILPCLILSLTTLSTLVSCDGGNSTSDVNEIVLDSISLKTKPTKLTYTEGEMLDTTGMEVIAKYSDNSTKAVTGYKVDKVEPLTVSDTTVVVSYTEAKVTKTCNFDITVNYREPIVIPIQVEQDMNSMSSRAMEKFKTLKLHLLLEWEVISPISAGIIIQVQH